MSTENQNRENQNEKVDYQDLFNSLVKENEQKEPMADISLLLHSLNRN